MRIRVCFGVAIGKVVRLILEPEVRREVGGEDDASYHRWPFVCRVMLIYIVSSVFNTC